MSLFNRRFGNDQHKGVVMEPRSVALGDDEVEAVESFAPPDAFMELRMRIHEQLIRELDPARLRDRRQAEVRKDVEDAIAVKLADYDTPLARTERVKLITEIADEILGLGPIQPLLDDDSVTEIMVNRPNQIYFERAGLIYLSERSFRDESHVMRIVEKIVAPLGRRIDDSSPMVDARLLDGSRINAIIPPLALDGPTLTVRKFARDPLKISDLISYGTLTPQVVQFLRACVKGRINVVVSGGTGTGKTTFLNVLSGFIPARERIVTIEDPAELQFRHPHVVRLETRPPNIEGRGFVNQRDLVRNALRMRPDRIIVGEVRAGEAFDMLQAMNTGHEGSLTTVHANSPRDALSRIENMVLMAGLDLPIRAIREQIASAINLVVHMQRLRDGTRRITQVAEVSGMEGQVLTMQDLYVFEHEGAEENGRIEGRLHSTSLRPRFTPRLEQAGIFLPPEVYAA